MNWDVQFYKINPVDISDSFDEVFDKQWAEKTFKNIKPHCERKGYDGYYLGGGIWFEFPDCRNISQ